MELVVLALSLMGCEGGRGGGGGEVRGAEVGFGLGGAERNQPAKWLYSNAYPSTPTPSMMCTSGLMLPRRPKYVAPYWLVVGFDGRGERGEMAAFTSTTDGKPAW